MSSQFRRAAGLTIAVGLVVAALGAAGPASASARSTKPPLLKATIGKKGLSLAGHRTLRPGRVAISLHAVGGERNLELISINKGYSFAKFKADVSAFGASEGPMGASAAGLKHLRSAIKHTELYGGLDADAGKTVRMTVVLNKTGRYYVYNDGGELPGSPKLIKIKGALAHRVAPKSTAVVTATSATRFGGSSVLPAHGTITFANKSTKSPHLLILAHVKKGTTRKQVIDYFESGSSAPPSFGLNGSAGTDSVATGRSQTLSLSLPAGTYAELCFFPDPVTGMPHAFMGMVRIVTLK